MKLYLSSVGIPDTKAFLALFGNKPRHMVIVPTAWNPAPRQKSEPFIRAATQTFEQLGFTHETLDLAGESSDTITERLAGTPAMWVTGGNSFYLNYWMRESGFDKLLPSLLKRGLIYGGESAGAVVAGKTLHGIELLDNPADAPEVLWPGLGLVNYGIIPHWGEQKYAGRLEQTYNEMQLFCPVQTISNRSYTMHPGVHTLVTGVFL